MEERDPDPDVHCPPAEERIFAKHPNKTASHPFKEILALHLRSLLPNPHPRPSISLPWLSRAVKLLALTACRRRRRPHLRPIPLRRQPRHAHVPPRRQRRPPRRLQRPLAEIECLRRGRLLLRFSLHLLAGEDHSLPLMPDRIRRAHKVIAEWEMLPRWEVRGLAGDLTRRLALGEPSCGKMSTVRRALYAVEAMATVVAVLSGGEEGAPAGVKISSDFPWGEALKGMEVAVSGRLRAGFPEAVEAAVRAVVGVIDGENDGEKAARFGSAVEELEGAMEELTEGLDPLSDAVNGLFRVTMHTTDAALQSLRNGLKCDGEKRMPVG